VARPPNGGRAHWREAQDSASSTFPPLALGRSSADELTQLLATAREWERRNRMRARVCVRAVDAVLFDRKPRAAVGFRWMAHDHQTESRPRWEVTFPAQAQIAAWTAGRAERERADGPVSVSGRMAAWHAERGLRASGPWVVFIFGPNFVVNSNISQFIFYSEII
jgi:hypothetical protein